jgi:hypothetical protein
MKQTAMQDLRDDLFLSIKTSEEALLDINDECIRNRCTEAVKITLNSIIKRIDEELLQMEKQQIIEAVEKTIQEMNLYESFRTFENGGQYYNETYGNR